MNVSKNLDPFRFLKRRNNLTPQKGVKSVVSQQSSRNSNILPEHLNSMAESKIEKLEETIILKQNRYDPNKYYSQKCQNYLQLIQFKNISPNKKANPQQFSKIDKLQTLQSQDSLRQIFKTKQKEFSNKLMINKEEVRELTFKKIQFQSKSESQQGRSSLNPQLALFNEEDYEIVETSSANAQLRQCSICGRRFNPNSYQKHVKICEKVFMNKRKPFSSQKQRSQSKDKKQL